MVLDRYIVDSHVLGNLQRPCPLQNIGNAGDTFVAGGWSAGYSRPRTPDSSEKGG